MESTTPGSVSAFGSEEVEDVPPHEHKENRHIPHRIIGSLLVDNHFIYKISLSYFLLDF